MVTKEFLPTLRHQRNGHIIYIGSLAGLVGVPFQGFYSASKHALEGYAKTLRFELEPFNIKVSIVEPGFFKTNIHRSFILATAKITDYDNVRSKALKALSTSVEQAPTPEIVGRLVSKIIQSENPKLQYRPGVNTKAVPVLNFFFPRLAEFGIRKKFQLR